MVYFAGMDINTFLQSEEGMSANRAEWARRCGVTRGYFSQLVLGKKRPSLQVAYDLEQITGGRVRMQDWFEDGETEA